MFEINNRAVNNINPSPITRFGEFAAAELVETTTIYYTGPNIRACLHRQGIDPNLWRAILDYNRIDNHLALTPEVTKLEVPRAYTDKKFSTHADE